MKKLYLIAMLLCLCAIGAQAQAQTQDRPFTDGQVWRVTYFKIKPGKGMEYFKFLREHTKPILDEQKKQGLIVDYKYFSQPTNDGPTDWDVAQILMFRNYAEALDYNEERSKKFNEIGLKHYGTAEARTKANDGLRDLRDFLSTHLVREQMLNPIK